MAPAWWPRLRAAEPAPAPASVEPKIALVPARAPMKISPEALAYAGAVDAKPKNPFVLPTPMPGVLPDGNGMAMDDAISGAYGFAGRATDFEGVVWLGYQYLAELAQRPEYRRASEIIAKEMTRKWIKLHATGDDDKGDQIKAIEAAFKRLKVREAFHSAAQLDGLFGRAQIYLDTGDTDEPGELETPLTLDPKKVGKGKLERLTVVEPIWTYPAAYNTTNPLAPDYYEPQFWFVMGKRVHRSRLLTFVGREVPDLLKPAYSFGGLSLSQMAKPYVDNWIRVRKSVGDLIEAFSTPVLMTDMGAAIQGGSGQDVLARVAMFNMYRNNKGTMVLNKETEEFKNVAVPLGTLDHLQAQSQEHMASVFGIPLVVLLGITPSGLNASSEGELHTFFSWIHAQQEHMFRPNLQRLLEVIQLSEFGEIDPEIGFVFEPLWELDEAARAAIRKTNSDTAIQYINEGVISPEEERQRLADEDGGAYDGLDPADLPIPPGGHEGGELNDPETSSIEREAEGAEGGLSGGLGA